MSHLIIKDLLNQIKNCSGCKLCEENCSVFLTTKEYPPHEKLMAVVDIVQEKEKPRNWEAVFLCTKCESCDVICPENIPITKIIDLGRSTCVDKWGIQYPRQSDVAETIFRCGNPFGREESRTTWLQEKVSEKSETLLHLGCMISYPLSAMGQNIIKILKKLEIDFTISPNEQCCGYFIYNTGNHKAAKELIEQNVKEFAQYENIITACAGCYTFLKEHYPFKGQLKHVIEVILEKMEHQNLDLGIEKKSVIFQDSCHIARPHGITEPPRKLLEKIGVELQEFDKSLCCGANGGMRIINPSLALEVGKNRLLEAKAKCDEILTLCPFCIHNFRDAAQKFNIDIKIGSIFEVLSKSIL